MSSRAFCQELSGPPTAGCLLWLAGLCLVGLVGGAWVVWRVLVGLVGLMAWVIGG